MTQTPASQDIPKLVFLEQRLVQINRQITEITSESDPTNHLFELEIYPPDEPLTLDLGGGGEGQAESHRSPTPLPAAPARLLLTTTGLLPSEMVTQPFF